MKTSLDPAEYELVQGVFKSLARAPWFDRTALNEKECAKLVLSVYSNGINDDDGLLAACLPEARRRFSKAGAVAPDAHAYLETLNEHE
jgi:hypothetical protein